ncbi:MAG TPA: alpha/beta hydrolase [Opitutaceae bacterium]|nr:alpha/beta hydrolase [Opitutaceae bacterium]
MSHITARSLIALLLGFAAAALRAEMIRNLDYGEAAGQRLLLDAHVPDGPGPHPVAILVHGGGWSSGDKAGSNHPGDGADISPWFPLVSGAHFTWFSINYRLAPKNRWPAAIDDLDTAIRWVKTHAAEYKGDPDRIVLFGHSAGGHMVMVAATQTDPTLRVQAVVGFAPVTDLVADSVRRGGLSKSLQWLFGLPPEITPAAREELAAASPIFHVHPGMPPILIVQGDADRTVPIQQSIDFIAKLKQTGDSGELITRHGAPHSLVQGEKIDTTYKAPLLAWLQRQLGSRDDAPGAKAP